ncbi:hypothetical protein AKJ61_03695 [candidate division MSBL1 archaeon SCGC-AAA259B11]|uniref:Ribosomal RNA small subunit methyltransferase Nep1 n=1 Tax=candidate division MSBL1 archaeon SCGC-AAA259B11 TaxID=1698260 RepID=A0A133U4D5_9EURY|nr:hypothetical protein AKJ61_03695 [candidate division MSBL1 archaeon SCGC-AAA259B11]
MLHLILADSELETVPEEISSDKAMKRKAQRRGRRVTELILDSNYYHKPMRKLEDSDRRGRPDIVQVCILTALDSPLNRDGYLRFYVHTRHDKVIDIDPETRIPRAYNRFVGLMEQLFLTGSVPPDDPLMTLCDESLETRVEKISPEKVLAFSKDGKQVSGGRLFNSLALEDDVCVVIGGFPHGNFLSDVEGLSDDLVSIYPETLDAVTVVNHVVQFYEKKFLNYPIFSDL